MNDKINPLDNYLKKEEDLTISNNALKYLGEIGKWSKLLAIVGFISIGLMLLFALFFGIIISILPQSTGVQLPIPSFMYSMIYMVIALIYYFPTMYLYKFSKKINSAISANNNEALETALENLKSCFKFIGIITIMFIIFYALIIIGAIIAGIAFS